MAIQRIFIHLIDGTDVWVRVNAKLIRDGQFEIIENKIYHELNSNELIEFFPGDVVELEERVLSDGSTEQVATKLISKGQWPDRKFSEFKYKAALKKIIIDEKTAQIFREEIKRIKTESAVGQIFYPTLVETVNKLDNFLNKIG